MESNQFARDVLEGLSQNPKRFFSKYFYDAKGDALFQQIMNLDEYYLTRSELSIFQDQKEEILQVIRDVEPFRLVELGAGDGAKTKVLLRHFLEKQVAFSYSPVDISFHVLSQLENTLKQELPSLDLASIVGDYIKVLEELKFKEAKRLVVFFLGSSIGNFLKPGIYQFLSSLHSNLKKGDLVMIGFDLKKEPAKILNAYNDAKGITRQFNLNLLVRINRELGGDFDTDQFIHNPVYDPVTGECRSYLISRKSQDVYIKALDRVFHFDQWEPVFMEVSRKYNKQEIRALAEDSGFSVVTNLFDRNHWFCESIWKSK